MKYLNKVLEWILLFLVAVMVLGCLWQIASRFLLNNPSKYTEEFLRYALIWLTMLGVPYAYGQDKHLAIHVIASTFTPKNNLITKIGIEILILAISCSVMVWGGWMVASNAVGQTSPAMRIPMQFYYGCVPISGVLMLVYCAQRIALFSKKLKEVK